MNRRTLLAMALAPMLPKLQQTRCKVGDWVRFVALPANTEAWASCKSQDLRRVADVYRRCLGGRFPVVYVGDDGRPELDVSTEVVDYSIIA